MTDEDRLLELIGRELRDLGFEPELDKDLSLWQMVVEDDEGEPLLGCIARLSMLTRRFAVSIPLAQPVPQARRKAVSEFALRLNFTLAYGALDLDLDNGWVQFRTGVCFRDTELTAGLIRSTLIEALGGMETWLDHLVAVIEAELDPAEAVQQLIERGVREGT